VPVYLGLDCSTQSFSAIAIAVEGSRREVLFERSVGFDEYFPQYGTRDGVLPSGDPLVARSSPLLWAEALDRMMEIVARDLRNDRSRLAAISGSAQQHGSVYIGAQATALLAALDPGRPLVAQVPGIFSRPDAPIWLDASTTPQCTAITQAMGGEVALARLAGSRACERFTGPQIRKFFEDDPGAYARTDKIHLVSSFLASLLAGAHAPVEPGDGAGTNLMDLASGCWSPAALDATAPGLAAKLPGIGASWAVVGTLAPYWMRRYGFPPARVVAWSGDNPCSLIGTGQVREGGVTISLGTSDTLFGLRRTWQPDPSGAGHVFGAPTGDYMTLVCCRNGSLARERVREEHGLDWPGFSRALRGTPPGNGGAILVPWFEPEVTPSVPVGGGARRYALDPADGPANVRAVVEAQMMALAIHSRWMRIRVETIHATGGAAANREILQVMANVHSAAVRPLKVGNSACLGAALRAYHAAELAAGRPIPWDLVVAGFTDPAPGEGAAPVPAHAARYAELMTVYSACESHARGTGGDPAPLIDAFRRRFRRA